MYEFILDDMLLPVVPSKLSIKTGNKNKTVELVSVGEVNILKNAGLIEFDFEFLLPAKEYPFAHTKEGFKEPFFYLDKLKSLKDEAKPFSFEVLRLMPDKGQLLGISESVSLEEYTVKENAGEEGDFWVSITLKEYRLPQAKVIKPTGANPKTGKTQVTETPVRSSKESAGSYTVASGDCLWAIAKRELNDGARYMEIAELNGIKDPNIIYQGQALKLPDGRS